jgi:hypothetical protein
MTEWSDKHAPRLDEGLQQNEQGGRTAGIIEDGIDVGSPERPDVPLESNSAIDPAEADQRSRLAQLLDPSIFPAKRGALLADAQNNGTADDEDLYELLRRLPDDQTFATLGEAWSALGGHVEHRAGHT